MIKARTTITATSPKYTNNGIKTTIQEYIPIPQHFRISKTIVAITMIGKILREILICLFSFLNVQPHFFFKIWARL